MDSDVLCELKRRVASGEVPSRLSVASGSAAPSSAREWLAETDRPPAELWLACRRGELRLEVQQQPDGGWVDFIAVLDAVRAWWAVGRAR